MRYGLGSSSLLYIVYLEGTFSTKEKQKLFSNDKHCRSNKELFNLCNFVFSCIPDGVFLKVIDKVSTQKTKTNNERKRTTKF